jgi:peptide deformylase
LERINGYLARVMQHEVDHLEGRFYLDRMETMLSLMTRENYMKYVVAPKKQNCDE